MAKRKTKGKGQAETYPVPAMAAPTAHSAYARAKRVMALLGAVTVAKGLGLELASECGRLAGTVAAWYPACRSLCRAWLAGLPAGELMACPDSETDLTRAFDDGYKRGQREPQSECELMADCEAKGQLAA